MSFCGKTYGKVNFGNGKITIAQAPTGGTPNSFAVKYNSVGTCQYARIFTGNNIASGIKANRSQPYNLNVTGRWGGTSNFGQGNITSLNQGTDMFIVQLSS